MLPDMNKLRVENEQLRKNLSESQSSQARSKYAFNSEAEYQYVSLNRYQLGSNELKESMWIEYGKKIEVEEVKRNLFLLFWVG